MKKDMRKLFSKRKISIFMLAAFLCGIVSMEFFCIPVAKADTEPTPDPQRYVWVRTGNAESFNAPAFEDYKDAFNPYAGFEVDYIRDMKASSTAVRGTDGLHLSTKVSNHTTLHTDPNKVTTDYSFTADWTINDLPDRIPDGEDATLKSTLRVLDKKGEVNVNPKDIEAEIQTSKDGEEWYCTLSGEVGEELEEKSFSFFFGYDGYEPKVGDVCYARAYIDPVGFKYYWNGNYCGREEGYAWVKFSYRLEVDTSYVPPKEDEETLPPVGGEPTPTPTATPLDVLEKTDADKKPGETGTAIPAVIILGSLIAGGAAVAGALSQDGDGGGKTFGMKVYKEFGDMVVPGQQYIVYARIVETTGGVEKDRPDLTAAITVYNDDGVFDVQQGAGMSGNYKGAYMMVSEERPQGVTEGRVNFRYVGEGGSYTNSMRFFVDEPRIEFNQETIALIAADTEIEELGYYVRGLNPDKVQIDLELDNGEHEPFYEVEDTRPEDERAPVDLRFILIGDKSDKPGTPGTFTVTTLTVTATEGDIVISNSIDIYRVTEGLFIGANRLACYRRVKAESAGKQVQDLTEADMERSYTEVPCYILRANQETHEVYHKPVPDLKIDFAPLKQEEEADGGDGKFPSASELIGRLGLTAKLKDSDENASIFIIYCNDGSLMSPQRYLCRMRASATDEEDKKTYTTEQAVLLESQPYREDWPRYEAADFQTQCYLDEIRDMIYDTLTPVRSELKSLNRLVNARGGSAEAQVIGAKGYQRLNAITNSWKSRADADGVRVFDKLAPALALIDVMKEGYDKHYGYDPLAIIDLRNQIETIIKKHQRKLKDIDQAQLVEEQETANYEANSTWYLVSATFAGISEKYMDTWGGLAFRIACDCVTPWAEVIFTALDANKAAFKVNEHKLLKDRKTGKAIWAGLVPVMMTATSIVGGKMVAESISAGISAFRPAGGIRLVAPPASKQGLAARLQRGLVKGQDAIEGFGSAAADFMGQVGTGIGEMIPDSVKTMSKNVNEFLQMDVKDLLTMKYDSKSKCIYIYESAASVDRNVARAGKEARELADVTRRESKSAVNELKSAAHRAAERDAEVSYNRFKKAAERDAYWSTPETRRELLEAYQDMAGSTIKRNRLNIGTRTRDEIAKGVLKDDPVIKAFNECEERFSKSGLEMGVKKDLASELTKMGVKDVKPEEIKIIYTSGNKAGIAQKTGMDVDAMIRFERNGKPITIKSGLAEEIYGRNMAARWGVDVKGDFKGFLKKNKTNMIDQWGSEYYHEVNNFLEAKPISDAAIQSNKTVQKYKMLEGFEKTEPQFLSVAQNPEKMKSVMKEFADNAAGKLSTGEMSAEARSLMGASELQYETVRQMPKTKKILENFNIKGMGGGNADAISKSTRKASEYIKICADEGAMSLDLGELNHGLEKTCGGYKNAVNQLVEEGVVAQQNANLAVETARTNAINNVIGGSVTVRTSQPFGGEDQ